MSFWICCFDKNCECCFDSCNKLKRHQRIVHAAESYRYAHCAISQDKKSYSVRILDQGQCITAAFQLRTREIHKKRKKRRKTHTHTHTQVFSLKQDHLCCWAQKPFFAHVWTMLGKDFRFVLLNFCSVPPAVT